jgi:hypothetical protein
MSRHTQPWSRLVALLAGVLLTPALGCHSLKVARAIPDRPEKPETEPLVVAPGKYRLSVSSFVFLADFPLDANTPLFRELAALHDQVYKELDLPDSTKQVQVYLFEDRARYERYMQTKYPDLPNRRAFFVVQPHTIKGPEDLLVFTFWGDRVRQDLRHELTHALLHSVLRDVPLWLDEGLAEYFEVPPETHGINLRHLEHLRGDESFRPDLANLEQLTQVQQMHPEEYREAWAWVHLMLSGKSEARAVLIRYLQDLRANNSHPGLLQPLLAEVYPDLEEALTQHLAHLDPGKRPTPTAQR